MRAKQAQLLLILVVSIVTNTLSRPTPWEESEIKSRRSPIKEMEAGHESDLKHSEIVEDKPNGFPLRWYN